jgi:hypothetical protein
MWRPMFENGVIDRDSTGNAIENAHSQAHFIRAAPSLELDYNSLA